jgi:hypothetical protein
VGDRKGAQLQEICRGFGKRCPLAAQVEVLKVLQRLLAVPHDACRESALHGLNHWRSGYRSRVREIVDQFLHHTPGIRRELGIYAVRVRDWYVP